MLRFNCLFFVYKINRKDISIHPMLRFNSGTYAGGSPTTKFQYILCYGSTDISRCLAVPDGISIHPMLRFNPFPKWELFNVIKFQYILCYGSTLFSHGSIPSVRNFNTSYVTVQRYFFLQIRRIKTISIHPMLRFNFDCYINE